MRNKIVKARGKYVGTIVDKGDGKLSKINRSEEENPCRAVSAASSVETSRTGKSAKCEK